MQIRRGRSSVRALSIILIGAVLIVSGNVSGMTTNAQDVPPTRPPSADRLLMESPAELAALLGRFDDQPEAPIWTDAHALVLDPRASRELRRVVAMAAVQHVRLAMPSHDPLDQPVPMAIVRDLVAFNVSDDELVAEVIESLLHPLRVAAPSLVRAGEPFSLAIGGDRNSLLGWIPAADVTLMIDSITLDDVPSSITPGARRSAAASFSAGSVVTECTIDRVGSHVLDIRASAIVRAAPGTTTPLPTREEPIRVRLTPLLHPIEIVDRSETLPRVVGDDDTSRRVASAFTFRTITVLTHGASPLVHVNGSVRWSEAMSMDMVFSIRFGDDEESLLSLGRLAVDPAVGADRQWLGGVPMAMAGDPESIDGHWVRKAISFVQSVPRMSESATHATLIATPSEPGPRIRHDRHFLGDPIEFGPFPLIRDDPDQTTPVIAPITRRPSSIPNGSVPPKHRPGIHSSINGVLIEASPDRERLAAVLRDQGDRAWSWIAGHIESGELTRELEVMAIDHAIAQYAAGRVPSGSGFLRFMNITDDELWDRDAFARAAIELLPPPTVHSTAGRDMVRIHVEDAGGHSMIPLGVLRPVVAIEAIRVNGITVEPNDSRGLLLVPVRRPSPPIELLLPKGVPNERGTRDVELDVVIGLFDADTSRFFPDGIATPVERWPASRALRRMTVTTSF